MGKGGRGKGEFRVGKRERVKGVKGCGKGGWFKGGKRWEGKRGRIKGGGNRGYLGWEKGGDSGVGKRR